MRATAIKGRVTGTTNFAWWELSGGAGIWVPADATRDDPGAGVTSRIVSAVATRPLVAIGRSLNVLVDRWWMAFNAAAVPPNGTAPSILPFRVPPTAHFGLELPASLFGTGYVWCCSTTDLTLTLTAAAEMWVTTWHRP